MYIARYGTEPITLPTDLTINFQNQELLLTDLEIQTESVRHENDVIFSDDYTPFELLLIKERLLF
jgi:hypothetical protein